MKRLVILGNSGFVGRRLHEYFAQHSSAYKVIGLASQDIDLTDDRQCSRLAEHFDLDTTVVMCSGIKSNYGSNMDNYTRNVAMAANVCRAVAKAPVGRFVFFSSIAVYGVDTNNTKISERTEVVPDTHYGLSKYDSEVLLSLEFSKLHSSSLVILRMPTMYGPHEKIIAATPSGFLTTYLQGGEVTLFGDGSELREFVFIEDVLSVLTHLLDSEFAGVLNVGSGRAVSYRDALDIISILLDKPLTIRHRERTKPKIDKVYDVALLRTLMPDLAFTPLEEGLRRILATWPSGKVVE
jgi:UDP-glucose 4-epimerase